jgi:glycosyltransferase involved in cell wall biosynthesis
MSIGIDISVIIPAYNAGLFIERNLKKLKGQTYKNFEAVIVNDGSKDNTGKIVKNFIKNNKLSWQLINQENMGEGEARNTGLKYARGKYILFLDADDYLANDALEKLFNALEKNNVDMVFSSYSYIYGNGKQKLYYHPTKTYLKEEIIKLFLRRLAIPGIGNTLLKKSIIDKYNLKFGKFSSGADNHFFRKFLVHVEKVKSINDNLFFYQFNENSVTNQEYNFKKLDSIFSILDTIDYYKQIGLDAEFENYHKIFLLNSVRGNALDYASSIYYNPKLLKEKILVFMPKNIPLKLFFSTKRTIWLLSLLFFYKSPIIFISFYKAIKGLKK